MSKKALELLGLKPKPEFKKEIQPVIIEKDIKFKNFDSESDDNLSVSSQKLRDVIQYLKTENDSDSISINDSDISDTDSFSDNVNEKFNMFKPSVQPKKQIQFSKQANFPISSVDNKGIVNIPKDRFIDLLERSRIERETKEQEQKKQIENEQKAKLKLEQEEQEQRFKNKYLQELLSTESLDSDNNENEDYIEYKLRQQLSLDDF